MDSDELPIWWIWTTISQVVWTTSVWSTGPSKISTGLHETCSRGHNLGVSPPFSVFFLAHQSHIRCYVHISVIYIYIHMFIYLFPCISYGISHCISQFCPIKLLPVLHNPLIPHDMSFGHLDHGHIMVYGLCSSNHLCWHWYLVTGKNPEYPWYPKIAS